MPATILDIPLRSPFELRPEVPGQKTIAQTSKTDRGSVRFNLVTEGEEVFGRAAVKYDSALTDFDGRGMLWYKDQLYQAETSHLYRGATLIGPLDGLTSKVQWAGGSVGTALLIMTPTYGYFWNGTVYTIVADATFNAIAGRKTSCAYLDGTFYVCGTGGDIWGSKYLNDATTWDALNRINAWQEPSPCLGVVSHRQYILALKEASTQVFYDAGSQTGSPLGAVLNATIPYGCLNLDTHQEVDATNIWVSQHKDFGLQVLQVVNVQPKVISTPAVERFLQRNFSAAQTATSFTAKMLGHQFYGLCLTDSSTGRQVTLVCNLTNYDWGFWTNSSGNGFNFIATGVRTSLAGYKTLLQTKNAGYFTLEDSVYTDTLDVSGVASSIPAEVYSPIVDGGSSVEKTGVRLDVRGDYRFSGDIMVSWSDDDYQTWVPWRYIPMRDGFSQLTDLGNFRRRAFRFRHESATPVRLLGAQLHVLPGLT